MDLNSDYVFYRIRNIHIIVFIKPFNNISSISKHVHVSQTVNNLFI